MLENSYLLPFLSSITVLSNQKVSFPMRMPITSTSQMSSEVLAMMPWFPRRMSTKANLHSSMAAVGLIQSKKGWLVTSSIQMRSRGLQLAMALKRPRAFLSTFWASACTRWASCSSNFSTESNSMCRQSPRKSQQKMHPQAHRSPFQSLMVEWIISGLMQICVPTQLLALLFCELNIAITSPTLMPNSASIFDWLSEENLASKQTASSKSISFSSPLPLKVMFEGFRSRWATFLPFRQASTSASSQRMYLMTLVLTSGRLSMTLRILSRLPLLQGSKSRQMVASSGLRTQLTNWMTARWCSACRMKMDLTSMRYLPLFSM